MSQKIKKEQSLATQMFNFKVNNNNIKNYLLNNYVVNSNIWCIDETYFSHSTSLFLVINLKTRAIIGYILSRINYEENPQKQKIKASVSPDLIVELYHKLFTEHQIPLIIHSDSNPLYTSTSIKKLCTEHEVQLSNTQNVPKNNQVIEGINNSIKSKVVQHINDDFDKNKQLKYKNIKEDLKEIIVKTLSTSQKRSYRAFRSTLPLKYKRFSYQKRATNPEFRKYLFNSEFFQKQIDLHEYIKQAINTYNSVKEKNVYFEYHTITRNDLEFYNLFVYTSCLHKAKENTVDAALIEKQNFGTAIQVKKKYNEINSQPHLTPQEKQKSLQKLEIVQESLDSIDVSSSKPNILLSLKELQNQLSITDNPELLKLFLFIYKNTEVLSNQNQLIFNQNETLETQLRELETSYTDLLSEHKEMTKLLKELQDYKNQKLQEQRNKEAARQKRLKAKRQQVRDPITQEEYYNIIEHITRSERYSRLDQARFRLMTCLLILTGCRISEILTIKFSLIYHLIANNSLPVDRKKGGKKQLPAFINKQGKELFYKRHDDIAFLLQYYRHDIRLHDITLDASKLQKLDQYIFQGTTKNKPLTRETFTNKFNKMLSNISEFRNKNKNFKSHSFRAGYITQLWKKSGDIELVRQLIGHANINSTVKYIRQSDNDTLQNQFNDITEED